MCVIIKDFSMIKKFLGEDVLRVFRQNIRPKNGLEEGGSPSDFAFQEDGAIQEHIKRLERHHAIEQGKSFDIFLKVLKGRMEAVL